MPLWFCQITEQVRVSNKHQRGDVWAADLFQQRIHSEKEDKMQDQFGKNVKEEEKNFTGIRSENLMPLSAFHYVYPAFSRENMVCFWYVYKMISVPCLY